MTEYRAVYRLGPQSREAQAQLARVCCVTNSHTRNELAQALKVKPSTVFNARKHGVIPDEWLLLLLSHYGINPDWIMDGTSPKYCVPSDDPTNAQSSDMAFPTLRTISDALAQTIARVSPQKPRNGGHTRKKTP